MVQEPHFQNLYSPVLAGMAHKRREQKKGADHMCDIMQELIDEAVAEAVAVATAKTTRLKEIDFVSNLVSNGISFDDAFRLAKVSAISKDELRKLVQPA